MRFFSAGYCSMRSSRDVSAAAELGAAAVAAASVVSNASMLLRTPLLTDARASSRRAAARSASVISTRRSAPSIACFLRCDSACTCATRASNSSSCALTLALCARRWSRKRVRAFSRSCASPRVACCAAASCRCPSCKRVAPLRGASAQRNCSDPCVCYASQHMLGTTGLD